MYQIVGLPGAPGPGRKRPYPDNLHAEFVVVGVAPLVEAELLRLRPVANVIKLFSAVSYDFS